VVREKLLALSARESWVDGDVADDNRLAAPAGVDDGHAEPGDRTSSDEPRDPVGGIRPDDDELVTIDFCVIDAAGAVMLADHADGDLLDLDRVTQGAEPLAQREEELRLGGHSACRNTQWSVKTATRRAP